MRIAPVVKWISHRSSEPLLWVRILPGAPNTKNILPTQDFFDLVQGGAVSNQ